MKRGRVVLVFVPGLGRGLLDGGAFPELHAALPSARMAGLVPSFPCLPATVEASSLRGQLPARHRVRLSGDDPSPAHPTVGERLEAQPGHRFIDAGSQSLSSVAEQVDVEFTLLRHHGLLETTLRFGLDSAERLQAALYLDAECAELRSSLQEADTLVIVGAPGMRPVHRTIHLPESLDDRAVVFESSVLRVKVAGEEDALKVQQCLLCCRGIERILRGEGLSSWGAALESERGELYALAQDGWSFEEQAASLGHPEYAAKESGLLIAFGAQSGPAWPPELHDYRLAPSLARRFDLSEDEYLDRAFTI